MAAPCKYHLFISFSGEDTRKNVTAHLLAALERHNFSVFRDDTKLETGIEIGTGLFNAIEQSKLYIIVFSKSYTSSRWCLDELVKIMNCKDTLNRSLIPIFYDGDPSDVRKQKNFYAFNEEKLGARMRDKELVENWTSALTRAGNLPGHVRKNVNNGCEATLIERVVRQVIAQLNPTCLFVASYPVGIEYRVQRLSKFLQLGLENEDVRIVAIWGFSGTGKTTIAKAMYNRIHSEFESSSFLSEVGKFKSLVKLQKELLRDLLKDSELKVKDEDNGIQLIKELAWDQRRRKVLLVLDDVDDKCQLEALAIDRDLLGPGSRVIITTRDLASVKSLGLGGDEMYMPEELSDEDSLRLFNWHAFNGDPPVQDYKILSEEVVNYSKGVPLVLEVLGSSLLGETVPVWRSLLKKLKDIPHNDVQEKLMLSLHNLDGKQLGLFLDIACFFVGMDQDLSFKILEGCGFYPDHDIGVLFRRFLVSIDGHERFMMHDLIQKMAREIVRRQSTEHPGRRSRLWDYEEVLKVLKNETGTEEVLGLVLNSPKSEKLDAKAFAKMKNLRLLNLNYAQLGGSCEHLSKELVWLSWKAFSLECIPSSFFMKNLVALDLSYSKLKQVWEETKFLCKLKYLNLSHSYLLIKTPDFTGLTSLEKLLLNDCKKLVEVHRTIGRLKNLIVLDIKNCKNLKKIPLSIFMLKSLADFNMSGCSKLEWPAFFRRSPPESSFSSLQLSSSIRSLYMENCNITNVPSEIGRLVSLEYLNLSRNKFSNLPATITSLPRLGNLNIHTCSQLESLPALPVSLKELWADDCTSLQSMSIESKAAGVQFMSFKGCPKLVNDNAAYNFRRNLLRYQGLREVLRICFPGGEVPRWCYYQSEGYFIRFRMPQLGLIIQGIIVCFVFSHRVSGDVTFPYITTCCVSNKTKWSQGPHCEIQINLHADRFEQMFLSYIPIRHLKLCWLEDGDEVEMTIRQVLGRRLGLWVKRLGVSLIYEGDENNPDS
ncbi:disease resistance protein RPV1-like [Cornus florida]|uniref:disease resistance protein RPV1-like n=1 Tax=Cornus florida TaxID=4283 RepID=UPI00289EAEF7|nr:disease resistance protein RPV1-like [Cornus florida]